MLLTSKNLNYKRNKKAESIEKIRLSNDDCMFQIEMKKY